MSSSGLIYAVIVGAWAAYLVPMWLRRQDELNEARPTERFSTAIRLLSGRAAMERRISRALDERPSGDQAPKQPAPPTSPPSTESPKGTLREPSAEASPYAQQPSPSSASPGLHPHPSTGRAALLARRRRLVTLLFVAFTLGMIATAVGGLSWLWAPGIPAILFTVYIAHLRRQERRRYEVRLDRRRAADAAQRLRDRERDQDRVPHASAAPPSPSLTPSPSAVGPSVPPTATASAASADSEADHRRHALVEATDHDEWVDGLRHSGSESEETWDPVPLPLPTYVTAPVAPRNTPALDLGAPDAWSAGRAVVPQEPAQPQSRPRTPLFDQYAEDPASEPRPRAANE